MLSITIRPRVENFKLEWKEPLMKYMSKKEGKYVIALEKGNHFQIAFKTTKRTDNVRKAITKLLQFEGSDDAERSKWLEVRSHRNPKYLIGYCVKEGDPKNIFTNYEDDEINASMAVYKETKLKIDTKNRTKKWPCTSINSICDFGYEYALLNQLDTRCSFMRLAQMMWGDDLIPASLYTKLRPSIEDLWIQYVLVKENATFGERWERARVPWDDKKLELKIQ